MNFERKLNEALDPPEPLDEILLEMFKKYYKLYRLSHTAIPAERRIYRRASQKLWKKIEQHPKFLGGLCPEFEAAIEADIKERGASDEPIRRDAPPKRDK